ncbi:MAG TPA: 7-cyano-7-deazaguanine synthase QueC [Acidimicrobiales bacterium]|jgi:7-cyano-7-deazaguanine synthase|nr:7-cyano-7-deazaguanine synthase QueC [Acidimicrobiales bacterium]
MSAGRQVIILSGGLDSTTCMALAAKDAERPPLALSFDYGQSHGIELERAAKVAAHYGAERLLVAIDTRAWGGSALTDPSVEIPRPSPSARTSEPDAVDIPVTYVPARNSIFLAVALGVAEARDADAVYLGVNALDYSGYPDCRPAFVDAFRAVAAVGQKRGLEGRPVDIRTPLVDLTKAQIIRLALDLEAPVELTWSCYRAGPDPCRACDACELRARGFAEAGVPDPALPSP